MAGNGIKYAVDQAATFNALVFLESAPKVKFGSAADQECTRAGVPKWDVQLTAGFLDSFGKSQYTTLKVTVVSRRDPGEGLAPFTPVELADFEIGVMDRRRKNRDTGQEEIVGHMVYHSASGISPIGAVRPAAAPEGDAA